MQSGIKNAYRIRLIFFLPLCVFVIFTGNFSSISMQRKSTFDVEECFELRAHTRAVHCIKLHVSPYDEALAIAAFVSLSAHYAAHSSF